MDEELFSLRLPDGWVVRRDEGRLYLVSQGPPGVLCSTAEPVLDAEELPNLSRMLSGFLTRTGHSVAPNELLIISNIPGAAGFCWQLVKDDIFYRFWVFGNRSCWLFWTFSSSAKDMDYFYPALSGIVHSLNIFEHGRTC